MVKSNIRLALLATACGTVMTPVAARAQSAPAGGTASPSDVAKADDTAQSDEIIVTAQKREERLQDVPLTVTVVSGAQLARQTITNITELQNASPELNYVGQPSAGYSIRGSGTQTFSRTAENNVLLVIDGVVQGQLTPPTSSLFDIARAEVLGGPQGTLFGRNASAGVVNIVTVAPDPSANSARGRLSLGEDGFVVANLVANLSLGKNAALRVSGAHEERDATLFNKFNSTGVDARKTTGGRARFLWEITPSLRINLLGDYEKERGGNNVWVSRSAAPGGATSIATLLAACGVTPSPTNTDVCLDGSNPRRILSAGGSFQLEADIGGGHTITNIFGYRRYERDSDTDSDTRPINALNENFAGDRISQYSEELRIASPSGQTLEYVAGVFFYDYRYRAQVDQSGTLGALPFIATASSTSFVRQLSQAVFGQATLKLSEQFSLIAGGRYTHDENNGTFVSYTDPTKGRRFAGFGNTPGTAVTEVDTNDFSYRVGAQYRPAPEATFFVTYTRGYKGPALNNPLAGGVAPAVVRPEFPHNLEGGVKASLFDRAVNVDFSVYHNVVDDFQAQTTATANGLTQFVFTNASKLTFNGAQLNIYARPAQGLSLTGGVLFNSARYGDFVVPCNAPFLTGCTLVGASQAINVKGDQLALAPRWKVTAGASYEVPLSSSLLGFVNGNMTYRSRVTTSPSPDPNLVIAGFAMFDARLGVRTEDGRFSVALFAKNLTDKRVPTLIFRDPLSPTLNYDQSYQTSAFRTVGVTIEAGF